MSAGRSCGGRSTACAVTATPFAAPMQATSMRRGNQRFRATVAQLTGRISKIAAAAKGLLQSYEETEG